MAEWIDKGDYEVKIVAEAKDLGVNAQIQLVRFKKGRYVHYHKKRTEFFYFFNGKGKAVLDGAEKEIAKGSFFLVKPYVKHAFVCESAKPLEAIMLKANNEHGDTYTD
jgi:quercetin dioxygenase-like cupin family protein